MGGTYAVSMGDRGRLVVPAELREHLGLVSGSPLLLVETDAGIVLTTREHARDLVRRQLQGGDLVDELVGERRAAAADDER
ncbi:AbrB/MazE/SpoVT family DNA-binding domain-containing protein [Actinomycetospora termitidis]|uniref:AbrB/MazE/SpoVT family DNA-binding domain-containing protein n=1 Tax=Actinomycetospora termitidis TaxID=3053470 RepID=A0ABT7MEF9_9PSEU|nr:AbrB/MazE/SpoVT family DNA-binding domain-containing protein [Actinomycetospora sp. Odt1-22]MDL5159035.1 AbrB/MazE/SpoVT family DNA-binding domain-containing protein [Actinomycetospora sp. Odt1-22]